MLRPVSQAKTPMSLFAFQGPFSHNLHIFPGFLLVFVSGLGPVGKTPSPHVARLAVDVPRAQEALEPSSELPGIELWPRGIEVQSLNSKSVDFPKIFLIWIL